MRKRGSIPKIKSILCLLLLGIAISSPVWPHGADFDPEFRPPHIGTGLEMVEPDDSLKLSLDLFGYLSGAAAGGFRTGEPLGAGGKIPHYYNQRLYQSQPFNRPHLIKEDLRPQYGDFSYIPLWQPTQFELRAQYRFFPRLWGSAAMAYSAELVSAEADDALHVPVIEEVFLKWAPEILPGASFSAGKLHVTSAYAPPFDQFLLAHYELAGLSAAYAKDTRIGRVEAMAVAAQEFQGRTKRSAQAVSSGISDPLTAAYLDGTRARTHFLATARFGFPSGFFASLLGGYQIVPEDSSSYSPITASTLKTRWRRSEGFQAGGEAGFSGKHWEHHLAASYGRGDVKMVGGGPDPVYKAEGLTPYSPWSWEGSALAQVIFWSGFQSDRWTVYGGAWGQWRMPAKDSGMVHDSLALRAQDFRAVKLAFEPAYRLGDMVTLGLRYDRIQYLDPMAHANTTEPLTDEALRGIIVTDENGSESQVIGPSRWEREAADCHVLSPFAQLEMAESFHARAGWSAAWYGRPVTRQGSADTFHANFHMAVWFTYQFQK